MKKNETVALAADQILWKLLPFEGRMLAPNDNNEIPSDVASMSGALIYQKPHQLWFWLQSIYQSGSQDELAGYAGTTYTAPSCSCGETTPLNLLAPRMEMYPLHIVSNRVE